MPSNYIHRRCNTIFPLLSSKKISIVIVIPFSYSHQDERIKLQQKKKTKLSNEIASLWTYGRLELRA